MVEGQARTGSPGHTADTRFVFERAAGFRERVAVIDDAGGATTYGQLLDLSARVAAFLLDGASDLHDARIAFLEPPGARWVALQWGTWRAGGVAVPVAVSYPPREIEHVLDDAEPAVVLAHAELAGRIEPLASARGIRFAFTDRATRSAATTLPATAPMRPAMILYTSGTTGQPKGVVSTQAGVSAMITTLVDAWGWSPADRILHVLPLHHVHGIINVLSCALWAGACCEFVDRFEPVPVWQRIASGDITLFMAVPTIYHRLITAWESADPATRRTWSDGARRLRLMVSGSAALPVRTLERWRELTGHTLLERYGMTEIGMALSNPLEGERRAGTVGTPLPGVELQLADDDGRAVPAGRPGQIEVRGPQVFHEYWRRPDETRQAFRNGWFQTGDEAVNDNGYYRILGRRSTDIIKSGGYKLSALEIEDALREHPAIRDCAVVGVPDADLGERVCAAIIAEREPLDVDAVLDWARHRLAPYKVPRAVAVVPDLPRNAMGKVTKPVVRDTFSTMGPPHAGPVDPTGAPNGAGDESPPPGSLHP